MRSRSYDYDFRYTGADQDGSGHGFCQYHKKRQKIGLAHKTDGSGYEPLSRIFHDKSISVEKHIHVVQRGREIVAQALGYTVDTPPDFGLTVPDGHPDWLPSEPYAVFFHGTSRDSKKWPRQNWIEIGQLAGKIGTWHSSPLGFGAGIR